MALLPTPRIIVIHHGDSFRAGHYTTLISDGAGHFSKLDDDRAKRRATPIELNHASHNTYLLLLVLHNDPSPQRLDSQDLIIEPGHGGRYQSLSASPVRHMGEDVHDNRGMQEHKDRSTASGDTESH